MADAEILCVGEVLWDALPAGLFLGGAPFNVACHLSAAGLPVSLVSRVGKDRLGEEALRRVARYGVGTDLVQRDDTQPTGFVRVTVAEDGSPAFEILAPAAWDHVETSDALLERARRARAIVFGSLAQRDPVSRATIERLWESGVPLVFDVNLRPPYDDAAVVRRSLAKADIVKLSRDELRQVAAWFDLDERPRTLTGRRPEPDERALVEALARKFSCRVVVVTRGREGAGMLREGRWTEQPGFEVEVRDTVGAGDAFLAVLLAGLLGNADDATVLQHAGLAGAYVATQMGAVPPDQPVLRPTPAVPMPAIPPAGGSARPGKRGRRRG